MSELMRASGDGYETSSQVGASRSGMGAALAPLALGLLTALSGCTALLETPGSQCSTHDDCAELFPDSTYQCMRNVCEQPFCDEDKTCRNLGGRFATSFCDTAKNRCVPAECEKSDDCGGGFACDLSSNRCVERECQDLSDCMMMPDKESPTVQCLDGFCVDPTWGCIGKPDTRNFTPGAPGTLHIPLFDPITKGPLAGAYWHTRVCLPADQDLRCDRELDLPTSYDEKTGLVTVEGLDPTMPVRLVFEETKLPPEPDRINGKATVDMEFMTQKPPFGEMTTPPLRVVTWAWIAKLIESYVQGGVITGSTGSLASVFRPGTQTIFGDAFDCEDKPAANLFVKFKDAAGEEFTDYTPYFWDEQNVAHTPPRHMSTFGTGVWSTANLPLEQRLLLRSNVYVDDRTQRSRVIRHDYPVYLHGARMMTVHLYPRDYTYQSAP